MTRLSCQWKCFFSILLHLEAIETEASGAGNVAEFRPPESSVTEGC
jgi:hypothetical protein